MPVNSGKEALARLLDSIAELTTYDAGRSRKFNRSELKLVSERDKQTGGLYSGLATAEIPIPEMERIVPIFRILLDKFIDCETDRIGNGLINLAGGIPEPTLSEYVKILIRAAAVLGGERTADLLIGWIRGEPVRYREISILNGITVNQPLNLQEGIKIYRLPLSSNELKSHLPALSLSIHGLHTMLGCVALSIESEACPALYHPTSDDTEPKKLNHVRVQGQIKKLSIDSLCEAMSLACNGCVQWRISWLDLGDVREFLSGFGGGISWTDVPHFTDATNFTQSHFECAKKIHNSRSTNEHSNPSLDTSIRRWIKSKASTSSFEDQLIDLRIAIESLYLNTNGGELRFRLACYGAWHIGQNAIERKEIFKTLMETYKLTSKAVHRGNVTTNDNHKKLVQNAQKLCREGILKRLEEEAQPVWNDLIMGD